MKTSIPFFGRSGIRIGAPSISEKLKNLTSGRSHEVMFVVQVYIMGREDNNEGDDLKRREYRDEAGRTHHHSRTFMRDHAGELRTLAA